MHCRTIINPLRLLGMLLAGLAATSLAVHGQGSLTPPGPPGPLMKTLSQVEPRTLISSLPLIITNAGSYYLAGNLAGAAGQNGITVQADNVTIDLNGFALSGAASSLAGIAVTANQKNFLLYNGVLRAWGGPGLDASSARNVRVERILAGENAGTGLLLGNNSIVADCIVDGNGGDGIQVGTSCMVLNNACSTNGTAATDAGIHASGTGNRIEGNNLTANVGRGIRVDGQANLIIRNNAAYNGITDYDIAVGSSYGQLLLAPGAGFTNASAWANFSSSCPLGQSFCGDGYCVALASNLNNCGACGFACSVPNSTPACRGGACVIAACNTGFADCNANPADGCEINLQTDRNNCGSCGTVCSGGPNAVPGCASGSCIIAACNTGYADCDSNPLNGCETAINSDIMNCGACGNVCNPPNAAPLCSSGQCHIGVCNPGFADCDHNSSNGCEMNISNNPYNCGGCGVVCNVNNATAACAGGACVIAACNSGYANCNGLNSDGCEVYTAADPNNCGACGRVCAVNNGTPGCVNSTCIIASCNAGFTDCNGNPADGCEVHTSVDPNNCGGCGHICNLPNATAGCASSACTVVSCNSGFGNCNGNPSDGCETHTAADPNNCGACGHQCVVNNGTAGCANSACTIASCNAGFADCNGNPADGCETNITNSPNNCGACGVLCPTTTSTCVNSTCKLKTGQTCTSGSQCVSGVCSTGKCT